MRRNLNKVNNRIHVKITCRIFDPSLNNKTTVTYVMMQTTQKDSFFKNNWFINEIHEGMENGHFVSKSFWYELKQWNFTKSLITSKRVCIWTKKHFGWILIFHSLSQVCEIIYWNIHRLKLFGNWINCNCCCWYTSKERNCIETTCIERTLDQNSP